MTSQTAARLLPYCLRTFTLTTQRRAVTSLLGQAAKTDTFLSRAVVASNLQSATYSSKVQKQKETKLAQTRTGPAKSEVQTTSVQEEGEPDALYTHVQVEVRGHDPAVLKSYNFFVTEAAKLLHIKHTLETPNRIFERMTLNKARFKYGKYDKVQYERRTHFRVINLHEVTGSTTDTYLEYIQRNLPYGVAMKVTRTKIEPIPEHIKRPEESELTQTS